MSDYNKQIADDKRWYDGWRDAIGFIIILPFILVVILTAVLIVR